jgi:hypothetical protein
MKRKQLAMHYVRKQLETFWSDSDGKLLIYVYFKKRQRVKKVEKRGNSKEGRTDSSEIEQRECIQPRKVRWWIEMAWSVGRLNEGKWQLAVMKTLVEIHRLFILRSSVQL